MDYNELEIEVVAKTEKALLCKLIEFDEEEEWIPFSQIEDNDEDFKEGWEGTIYVTEWLCKKNGWT